MKIPRNQRDLKTPMLLKVCHKYLFLDTQTISSLFIFFRQSTPNINKPTVSVYFNLRFSPMIGLYSLRVDISIYLIFNPSRMNSIYVFLQIWMSSFPQSLKSYLILVRYFLASINSFITLITIPLELPIATILSPKQFSSYKLLLSFPAVRQVLVEHNSFSLFNPLSIPKFTLNV